MGPDETDPEEGAVVPPGRRGRCRNFRDPRVGLRRSRLIFPVGLLWPAGIRPERHGGAQTIVQAIVAIIPPGEAFEDFTVERIDHKANRLAAGIEGIDHEDIRATGNDAERPEAALLQFLP